MAMQICPEWLNDPKAPTETAFSRSTSSSTISAEFPPSSRCTRLSRCAAAAAMIFPALVDPVNAMTGTSGCRPGRRPRPRRPGSMWNRPSGRPASSKILAKTTPPQIAVRGSGLQITAFPSARAGAMARIARMIGRIEGGDHPDHTDRQSAGHGQPGLVRSEHLPDRMAGESRRLPTFLGGDHPGLELRERPDRAGFTNQPVVDFVLVFDEQVTGSAEHGRAAVVAQRGPFLLRLRGPFGRVVHVSARCGADGCQALAGGRLDGVVFTPPAPCTQPPEYILPCHIARSRNDTVHLSGRGLSGQARHCRRAALPSGGAAGGGSAAESSCPERGFTRHGHCSPTVSTGPSTSELTCSGSARAESAQLQPEVEPQPSHT